MSPDYVALIPARGGSRGIPRKNLEIVGDLSLLERAIKAGRDCSRISGCYVSSDDKEILEAAVEAGAVGHLRPSKAAADNARATEVVKDFVKNCSGFEASSIVVYLQPTSPFRTGQHIDEAIRLFEESGAKSLVSVVKTSHLPEKTVHVSDSGIIGLGSPAGDPGANRQDLEPVYSPNGAIYIFDVEQFEKYGDVPVGGAQAFIMGKVDSLDIDDLDDLILARGVAAIANI